MFKGIYQCNDAAENATCITGSHPYIAPREFTRIANFVTTDGACFYIENALEEQLVAGNVSKTDQCSLRNQIARIMQGNEAESLVRLSTEAVCDEIIDWPAQPMQYRNGEQDERDPSASTNTSSDTRDESKCALLPR
eukprot:1795933-Rhodomonas_salina.1